MTGSPKKKTCPADDGIRPAIISRSVDFPQPDGPTIARAVSKNVVSDVPMTEWERVIVDSEGGQVQIDGYPIHMSREECILLKRLLQAEGAVVYRDELVENLWSEVSVHSRRRLDGVVQRVRKRLYGTRLFIVSKYGKGYYLQYHKEEKGG